MPVSSSSLTLFVGICALDKASNSPVLMDWPHIVEDPYQSAQPEIPMASQNFMLVPHAYFVLCSPLVSGFGEGNGTHSTTLAWKIPWMEEPGGLQSMGSQRVGHYCATSLSLFTFMHWRRKWQPTPVFLPGESQGWGSLVGCRLWGRTESDTTEATWQQQQQQQQPYCPI